VCMSKRKSTLVDELESHSVCATSNQTYNACVYDVFVYYETINRKLKRRLIYDVSVGFPITNTQFVCTVDSGHLNYYGRRTVGAHFNMHYAGALPIFTREPDTVSFYGTKKKIKSSDDIQILSSCMIPKFFCTNLPDGGKTGYIET
jgi:hypothetical protein